MGNCITSRTSGDSLVPESPSHWDQEPRLEQVPNLIHLPVPSLIHQAAQLTEEEQVRIAQRISLIEHLPQGVYGTDGLEEKIQEECGICWLDFVCGDPIRSLPCKHVYHLDCIDEWLTRSFNCPYCRGPVDVAELSSQDTN
ncbi:RING finger protein 11-like [Hippopotamus amphibius kiboko]|uniref:RING finger protein 11-like n=1 Tax=Hippopotamus amphibius kiboko TaxID=575201 RepID=UPI002594351F|nr:RING finger protein 11-like [Hippopotamus amphibius kiboko]XP_057552689.1 RING finger protein 11-like [Hippopotamus amphibius kiboko]